MPQTINFKQIFKGAKLILRNDCTKFVGKYLVGDNLKKMLCTILLILIGTLNNALNSESLNFKTSCILRKTNTLSEKILPLILKFYFD